MYFKYDYCPGFDSTNHYSAVVIKKNEVQQLTQPPASKPTPPPPRQPTQPPASNPAPPPTPQCKKLQEKSSENEEPVNIEDIQNQTYDLQKKQKKNPHKKEKKWNEHASF